MGVLGENKAASEMNRHIDDQTVYASCPKETATQPTV